LPNRFLMPMRRTRLISLAICFFTALLLVALDRAWAPVERWELQTLDWRFVRRGARPPGAEIVLVAIDEKSLTEMPRAWPWARSVHADVVEYLHRRGATAIVFDLLFAERRPQGDGELAAAMRRAGNVFLAANLPPVGTFAHGDSEAQQTVEISMDRVRASEAMVKKAPPAPERLPSWLGPRSQEFLWSLPLPEFVAAARGVGFVDMPADADAVYRRTTLVQPVDNGRLYPHLSLAVAAGARGVAPGEIRVRDEFAVAIGEQRILPVSPDGTFLIDFVGAPPSATRPSLFPRYSYSEVYWAATGQGSGKRITRGAIPRDAFRGKIVLIGATAPGIYDVRPSPYSPVNVGVETNANLTNAILQGRVFVQPGPWLLLVVLALFAGGAGWALGVVRMRPGALVTVLAAVAYAWLALWLFRERRVVIPMATPLLCLGACYAGVTAYRFQAEFRERFRTVAYLQRYLTPQVANRVLHDPKAAALGGRRTQVSVLFADIRGFTPLSEQLGPEEVIALLNAYFAKMEPPILAEQGILLQFVGDEIMAVWGMDTPQPDHACHAVRAGMAMHAALRELQAEWRERGLPSFEIGVAVHSGDAIVGNVGTAGRRQYSVIGDTVNTASRLEGLNKEMGTRMLISAATYEQVGDLVSVRALPPVRVKGKAEALQVYEVLGLGD
jgi:adenylate cyclase